MALKTSLIKAGFASFALTRLHRPLQRWTRGRGAILTFHRVRPFAPALPGYAPNRLLEITPEFLDAALDIIREEGFDVVSLPDAMQRLSEPTARPFIALTFDDATRDLTQYALPILERHRAPFAAFVATGFAAQTARLWWLELEAAIARLDAIAISTAHLRFQAATKTATQKSRAFASLYAALRALPEAQMLEEISALDAIANVDPASFAPVHCLDWRGIERLAGHPLVEIGAHSVSHKMLSHWPRAQAMVEMADSKAELESRLGRGVNFFAYPVGDARSAGAREFALAREQGFAGAVTTRPGMIFAGHDTHRHALPRVSVNGLWQSPQALRILLSGAPLALWRRGRRIDTT